MSTVESPSFSIEQAEQESQIIPSIDWWITSRCNLACDFCYGPLPARDPAELRVAIADQLAASPAETITFCGGEPLILGEETLSYARMFKAAGKRVILNSNGELLERTVKKFLRSDEELPFDVVGLSVEGPTQETHAQMRADADLAATFRAAQLVKSYEKSLKVATVVSQVNVQQLPELAEFVRYELDPDVWRLYQYNPNGPYNRGQERHTLSKEEFDRAMGRVILSAHNMPTYPSDNESQNSLIVDPKGELSLSTSEGYRALGGCAVESISAIWEREPETVRTSVARNKRWIGATAMCGALYPYENKTTNWYDWKAPEGLEGRSSHGTALSELDVMRRMVAREPEKFREACIDSLPETLSDEYKETYWLKARGQLVHCNTDNTAETMKTAFRFVHYYDKYWREHDALGGRI